MDQGRPARPRRGFLRVATGSIGGALVAAGCGRQASRFLAHPLWNETARPARRDFVRVAAPEDVHVGTPLRVDVIGQRRDGWMRFDRMKLGSAWLVRAEGGRVRAFSTACPHLGCGIDWNDRTEKFECPCHKSGFGLDGSCLYGPSPRGLDELDVASTPTELRLRYQRFKVATSLKEPIG